MFVHYVSHELIYPKILGVHNIKNFFTHVYLLIIRQIFHLRSSEFVP